MAAVLKTKIGERFGDQLMGDAVSAARAVMGLLLKLTFAFVLVVERRRFLMDNFVAVHNSSYVLHQG